MISYSDMKWLLLSVGASAGGRPSHCAGKCEWFNADLLHEVVLRLRKPKEAVKVNV